MADISSLGKYEIRRQIGRGAMGVVYEGYDPLIKRIVALKTIRADQLADDDSASVVARFRREAQAAGRLNHPNIVSIYDFGEDAGVWYIAMEFVQGRELKECFEGNERFRIADIGRIMGQILGALDYSHRQGVVHRDIKPANIFLLPDGTVKVADFGIAHIEASNLTQAGTVMGTPSYMSPEQIQGLPVDGRSDLFSAGVILYQFLTGERPFAGSSTTTMQKVLKEDPMPPSLLNVQVMPEMDAVVRKALAKRPDDRYQSAREFADAISGAVAIATATATLSSAPDATVIAPVERTTTKAAAMTAATTPAAPVPPAAPPAPASRNPAILVVAAAALVAIAAGWYWYQHQGSAMTAPQAPDKISAAPPAPPATPTPPPVASRPAPGTLTITAVGLVDPSDPRYQGDKSLMQGDLRADSKSQVVEKAIGLLVDTGSIAKNYELLKTRLLSKSGDYITAVVRETPPEMGKDGLMAMTTEAVVNVKAVQKTLNEMTRDERVEFIRASGDPRISVAIAVRDADAPDAPPLPSPVAENLLKERVKAFGFRTWSEGNAVPNDKGADFAVQGEAKIKRLSMQLPASGVTVTKYALTSWTVKCLDRDTGEEIYFNTTLPQGMGSFATEEEALKAIGGKVADAFSRDFFLQHANVASQKVSLSVDGMPSAASEDQLAQELIGLPAVIAAKALPAAKPRVYELQLAGSGAPADLVANGVLKPLNAQLGQPCFSLGASTGEQVSVVLDKRCADSAVLSRLETNPPAGLYGAPAARQKAVVRNPEMLKKLAI
jgi:serine/threonine-protein kinase